MAMGPLTNFRVDKDLSTNASLVTTPAWFVGDFRQLTISASTQSINAINVQMSNADGFQSPIPENSWANVLLVIAGSVTTSLTLPVGYRWSRTSSPASSNNTLIFAGRT
jgi:hypothetical protein